MIDFRFDLYREGELKAELIELATISFGYRRNEFVDATFTHNANDITDEIRENLIEGSELRVFFKGENEDDLKLIWAGEIQRINRTIGENDVKLFTVAVKHWGNVFLKNRFITKTFTSEEEEDIAWGLIDETQTDTFSGTYTADQVDWGIQQGVLEATSNTRTKTYAEDEILKSLRQLANLEDVTPNPQRLRGFRLTPDLTDERYHYLEYEAEYGEVKNITYTDPSISNISEVTDATKIANRIVANGASGLQETAASTDQDHLDFWKLRQAFISRTNVTTSSELQDEADAELEVRLNPDILYNFKLVDNDQFVGEYRVGDTIGIIFEDDEGFISLDTTMQVYEIKMKIDEKNVLKTDLVISINRPNSIETKDFNKLLIEIIQNSDRLTELEK